MKELTKNPTTTQLIHLIQQQNQLIQQQNALFQQLIEEQKSFDEDLLLPEEKILVKDLFHDEIRDGFVVTAQRKRLWNIQLNLVAEVARICEKHNIRWFAYGGTLLGAVRHKGFVPWDDDVDIVMFRPDYERFKKVVKTEIKEQYFVDAWYDYKLEDEEPDILQDKNCLQVVKHDQRRDHPKWWPFWPMIKIRDSRTTMIQWASRPHVHQGIWIDIFPLDPVPPFSDKQQAKIFETERELFLAMVNPEAARQKLAENMDLIITRDEFEKFLDSRHAQKAAFIDSFALENFSSSAEFFAQTRKYCLAKSPFNFQSKSYEKVIYLPFETMEIPAPDDYKDCLKRQYGVNWRKPVFYKSHTKIYSANISYKDYFEQVRFTK